MKPVKELIKDSSLHSSTQDLRAYFRVQNKRSLEYLHDYQFTNMGARALMNLDKSLRDRLKVKVCK